MGKRGLYANLSVGKSGKLTQSIMDFLQYAEGINSLQKISNLIGLDLIKVKKINKLLLKNNLISN